MKKISIMIPCYNESANVEALYAAVTKEIDRLERYEWEIIFEDNCSTDNTVELLRAISERDKRVRIIVNQSNYGPERNGSNLFLVPSTNCGIKAGGSSRSAAMPITASAQGTRNRFDPLRSGP